MTSLRRRAAFVLLPLAVVTGGALLWGKLPMERDLVIDLGEPAGVRRVAVNYWRVDAPEERAGFSHVFSAQAPRRLRHPVSLRSGDHVVEIRVERSTANDRLESTVERHVSITGREVIVFAAPPAPRGDPSLTGVRSPLTAEPVPPAARSADGVGRAPDRLDSSVPFAAPATAAPRLSEPHPPK